MIKLDKPLNALLLGAVVILPLEVYTQVLKYFNLTELSTFEYTSLIVNRDPDWWVGLIAGPGTAATATLILYYSTIIWGVDYLPFKGAYIGSVTYSFIAILKSLLGELELMTTGHFVHASGGFIGGLLAGYLLKKYLLKEEPVEPCSSKKPLKYYLKHPFPSLNLNEDAIEEKIYCKEKNDDTYEAKKISILEKVINLVLRRRKI